MKLAWAAAVAACAYGQAAADANKTYQTAEGRARIASTLGAHDRDARQRPKELIERIGIRPGMTVADIGTGVGYMLPHLSAAVGPDGRVIAEDIFRDFLDKAREKRAANIVYIIGNEKDTLLPPGVVDVALILDAYHHFDYPKEMLASIHRGLKPGGRLALVEFYKRGFRDPAHIRLDEEGFIREISENGFELIESKPFTPDSQYLAIFRKK